MVHALDESLELFLRARVPLGVRDIDVSFQAPDRTWSAGINRPTVNLFLFDVRRSSERGVAGREAVDVDGAKVWRRALPRIEFRYLLSAWANDAHDEHQLLGAVLTTLLGHDAVPAEYLPTSLVTDQSAPTLQVASTGSPRTADPIRLLDGQLKAVLELTTILAIDPGFGVAAGAPTVGFELRANNRTSGASSAIRRLVAGQTEPPVPVGTTVRSPRGSTTSNSAGSFLVAAQEGDEIFIDTEPSRRVVVPAAGGVVL